MMSQPLLIAFVMFFTPGAERRHSDRDPLGDGRAAARLALSGVHGRMNPLSTMQKRVSLKGKNALDNAGNSRATGGPDHPKA
jgi:hypothetical protein